MGMQESRLSSNKMTENYLLNSDSIDEFKHQSERVLKSICKDFDIEYGFSGAGPQEIRQKISNLEIFPEKGFGFDKTMDILDKNVLPDMLKVSLFGIMAHLHTPVLMETISAETLISSYNQSMDSWDQAPVMTEVEIALVEVLKKIYGFSENADGTFTSGGTQSNLQAVLIARDKAYLKMKKDIKKSGINGIGVKMRVYTSEIAHFSFLKSCHILGMGYDSVRMIPVNDKMQMDCEKLEQAIKEDIESGIIPCMVAATVGTTDFGSIDNLKKIGSICYKYSIHFHADAAYGSACILSKKYRSRVEDLKLCDSVTIDFHKMFLMPISCSCILVKNANDFDCLSFHADYLNRQEDEDDGYCNLVGKSLLTTRRADCLKLLMSFMTRGREGFDSLITKMMDNAFYFYSILDRDDNIETLNTPELTSVVFRCIPKSTGINTDDYNKKLRRTLMHSRKIIIGQTVHSNKVYLKFTLLNPSLEKKDFDKMLEIIKISC